MFDFVLIYPALRPYSGCSWVQADLHELPLHTATFGTKFDVVLIDPPWEEYGRRAPGVDVPTWALEGHHEIGGRGAR